MLRIHSFLQSIYGYVKSISKRLYRTCAIITTGAAVIAVIAFSSQSFGGSGKNHVITAYPSQETDSEYEEAEEAEADTEVKIQTGTIREDSEVQSIKVKEARIESQAESVVPRESAIVMMAGERGTETISEYEYDVLLHIVAAEARGCDVKGQILVANVILNRVENDAFPDTIEEVVYQKNQFSPVVNGTLWDVPVTDSVKEAVDRALAGEDYSQGALFFSARARLGGDGMAWFDSNLDWLFEYGGHEFYTFK